MDLWLADLSDQGIKLGILDDEHLSSLSVQKILEVVDHRMNLPKKVTKRISVC
jgi:hypothetical protein